MSEETTPQKDLYRSGARVKCVRLRPLPYKAGARQAALVQKVINNSTLKCSIRWNERLSGLGRKSARQKADDGYFNKSVRFCLAAAGMCDISRQQ